MKNLNLGYWNCGSGILNKLDLIKDIISVNKLDILFISETNIGEFYGLNLLNISGFDISLPYHQQHQNQEYWLTQNLETDLNK